MQRPQLDAITLWRGEQIARQENRTLPAAIGLLVGEAWAHRMNKETARCLGIHIDLPTDKEARTVSAHLPGTVISLIERTAEREQRSVSQVVRMLVGEALATRGVFQPEGAVATPGMRPVPAQNP